MDQETFETLVEVLAFECAHDHNKSKAFRDIFYGRYSNKGASFVNLDAAMGQARDVTVISHGKPMAAYVTSCEWSVDADRMSYMGPSHSTMKIRLELTASER